MYKRFLTLFVAIVMACCVIGLQPTVQAASSSSDWKTPYLSQLKKDFKADSKLNSVNIKDVTGGGAPEMFYRNSTSSSFFVYTVVDGKAVKLIDKEVKGFIKEKSTGKYVAVSSKTSKESASVYFYKFNGKAYKAYFTFRGYFGNDWKKSYYIENGKRTEFKSQKEVQAFSDSLNKKYPELTALSKANSKFEPVKFDSIDLKSMKSWAACDASVKKFFDKYKGASSGSTSANSWAKDYYDYLSGFKLKEIPYSGKRWMHYDSKYKVDLIVGDIYIQDYDGDGIPELCLLETPYSEYASISIYKMKNGKMTAIDYYVVWDNDKPLPGKQSAFFGLRNRKTGDYLPSKMNDALAWLEKQM